MRKINDIFVFWKFKNSMTLHSLITVGQIFLNSKDIQYNLNNNKDHYLYSMKWVLYCVSS